MNYLDPRVLRRIDENAPGLDDPERDAYNDHLAALTGALVEAAVTSWEASGHSPGITQREREVVDNLVRLCAHKGAAGALGAILLRLVTLVDDPAVFRAAIGPVVPHAWKCVCEQPA